MRQVYHLGLHKTGSTSLQHFLWRNRQALLRQGVLFPAVTPQARDLFDAADAAPGGTGVPPLNAYMGHNALAYRMISEAVPGYHFPPVHAPMLAADAALADILPQARKRGCDTVVLCSEDLARVGLMAPQSPARFAAALGPGAVMLIAAIRRPDAALAAWQTQKLRFGEPFPALREMGMGVGLGSIQVEYQAALSPWLRAFPKAERRILPYDALCAMGGSVTAFPRLAGLEAAAALVPVPDANPGLPHALLEIARLGLAALPRPAAARLRDYLETVARRLPLPPNDAIELFAPGARETLFLAFHDIHHWLCQVTGRVPFFEDLDEIRRPRLIPELQAAREALPELRRDARTQLTDPAARDFLENLSLGD